MNKPTLGIIFSYMHESYALNCIIFKEDKLHLGITFSCKHESYALNLHYLCL